MLIPKGMSAVDVMCVREAPVAAFNDPAVENVMAKQGNTINIGTPKFAQGRFRSEKDKYALLVKKVGIKLQ